MQNLRTASERLLSHFSHIPMQHKHFLLALSFMGAFPLLALAQNRVISTDNTNIAAAQNGGRVLSVTSTFDNDPLYAGSNLIDGQVWSATRAGSSRGWASNQYDPISMDAVTLGFTGNRIVKLGRIVINPLTDLPPERWVKDIEVQVSTESAEGPYQPVAQLTLRQQGVPQSFDILPVDARYVRLQVRSNYGSDRAVALGEIEMYEAIDAADPMGGVINRLEKAVAQLDKYKQLQAAGGIVPAAATPTGDDANFRQVQLGQRATSGIKTNIAATKNGGRIVASSSTYNNDATYGPQLLIDGDNFRQLENKGSNGWASQGFAPGKEFVTVGFADDRTHLLGRVTLNPASNQSDLRWARRVELQTTTGSASTGPWKTTSVFNLRPEPVNQDFSFTPVEAKYARFVFQANGPGIVLPNADPNVNSDRAVSLGEIEIYEAQTGDDQLDAILGQFNGVLTDLKTLRRRDIDAGRVSALPFTPSDVAASPAPKAQAKPKPVSTKPVLTPPATPTKVQSKIAPVKSIEKRIEASIPKRKIGTG